jgi:hypothetical protein
MAYMGSEERPITPRRHAAHSGGAWKRRDPASIAQLHLDEEIFMAMMQLKALAVAVALGTAVAATAQTGGYGSSGTRGVTSGSGSTTAGSTTGSGMSGSRPDPAMAICKDVPASQREACLAREHARQLDRDKAPGTVRDGRTTNSGMTAPSSSSGMSGGTTGSSSGTSGNRSTGSGTK